MVTWNITVGGNTITDIFDVDYNFGETDRIGKARVICANNSNNRNASSGEEMVIKKNGTIDFTGYLSGKPTHGGSKNVELELEAIDKRSELKYQQVNRVFYQKDTGAIIRDAINNQLEPVSTSNREFGNFIHKGASLSNWNSETPQFSLGGISNVTLEEAGGDFIFCGWPEGSGKEQNVYSVTYSSVPSRTIPGDGQVDTFYTRILVNNSGQQFSLEIDLRDNAGNNYIWQPDISSTRFQTIELKAEDAVTSANIGSKVTSNGTLEYRFKINGSIPEGRGAAIDFASTIPYKTTGRTTDISPSDVDNNGNVITRRIDRSIFEMIREFSTEDGYVSYVDKNDSLHYEKGGQTQSSLSIDFNTTPVTDAKFNRDYEQIVNKVTVQGDGNVRATVEDSASINFYGISSREEPIVDEQIQTRTEAIRRGKGYLSKHAWNDSAFEFEIADTDYQTLRTGEEISVNWPPESINGTFVVSDVKTDYNGIVTVSLTNSDTL